MVLNRAERTEQVIVYDGMVKIRMSESPQRCLPVSHVCCGPPAKDGNGLTRLSCALRLEAQEETGKNNTDVTAEDEVSKAFLDKVIRVHNQQRDSAPRPTGSQASGVLRGQWQSET